MLGIAINRFGYTPGQFYRLSPLEFHNALKDHRDSQDMYFGWVKFLASVLRIVGMIVFNSAFGRKRKDKIDNPERLIQFNWEKPKIQTVEEMKATILGLAHLKGVKVTQKGKEVKMDEES